MTNDEAEERAFTHKKMCLEKVLRVLKKHEVPEKVIQEVCDVCLSARMKKTSTKEIAMKKWGFGRIGKQYSFSAAHHLPMTPASHPCHRMHGHNYVVEIEVRGDIEAQAGWIIDFHHIDQNVKPIIDRLDHQVLNDFIKNPTAENIAQYIMDEFPVKYVFSVTVWETPKCWAKVINREGFYTQEEKVE